MKNYFSLFLLACMVSGSSPALGQVVAPIYGQKQLEFSIGIAIPNFNSGKELIRARGLREAGQSYYADGAGQRRQVGSSSAQIGWSFEVAYHKPLAAVPGLLYGVVGRSALTGSQPSEGKYAEGYFFNFLDIGPSLKYYPFTQINFFVRGQAGLSNVFTKNRYLTATGEQEFFHQFGIGISGSLAAGYTFTPFANKAFGIETKIAYQLSSTRVEVNGLGDDQWQFGALHFQLGLVF
jgi:hypothetical protein